jgi:hypothetical protein
MTTLLTVLFVGVADGCVDVDSSVCGGGVGLGTPLGEEGSIFLKQHAIGFKVSNMF